MGQGGCPLSLPHRCRHRGAPPPNVPSEDRDCLGQPGARCCPNGCGRRCLRVGAAPLLEGDRINDESS
eukprot:gene10090-1820_t